MKRKFECALTLLELATPRPPRLELLTLPNEIVAVIFEWVHQGNIARTSLQCKYICETYMRRRCATLSCAKLLRPPYTISACHWSSDMERVCSLLAQPRFYNLRTLLIDIDTPCFQTKGPTFRGNMHDTTLANLKRLRIRCTVVNTLNFSPSATGLSRLLLLGGSLTSLRLDGIRNLCCAHLVSIKKLRSLQHLKLGECRLSPNVDESVFLSGIFFDQPDLKKLDLDLDSRRSADQIKYSPLFYHAKAKLSRIRLSGTFWNCIEEDPRPLIMFINQRSKLTRVTCSLLLWLYLSVEDFKYPCKIFHNGFYPLA